MLFEACVESSWSKDPKVAFLKELSKILKKELTEDDLGRFIKLKEQKNYEKITTI